MIRQEERLDMLERVLAELIELNQKVPIVVEGRRDLAALRLLGVTGEIHMVHKGISLLDFCDRLAMVHDEVVLLTDWDRTGGSILRHLRNNLRGRVKTHPEFRKSLALYSEVQDVESLPAYLKTLRQKVIIASRDPRGTAERGA